LTRDIRVCKRYVNSIERFHEVAEKELEDARVELEKDGKDCDLHVFEVFDAMRNHFTDEIANEALLFMLEKHKIVFKIYVMVRIIYFIHRLPLF